VRQTTPAFPLEDFRRHSPCAEKQRLFRPTIEKWGKTVGLELMRPTLVGPPSLRAFAPAVEPATC
jgi:hypothetical protein